MPRRPSSLAAPLSLVAYERGSAVFDLATPPRRVAGGFNPNLHGARGLLALFVFLFHIVCSGAPGFPAEDGALPHAMLMSLQFGVEIFFCISGFIVVGALTRARSPTGFMRDRAIRILPVLWVTLAVLVPLGLLTHQGQFADIGVHDLAWIVPANLLALAGVFPVPVLHLAAWSLSYELLFYIIAAASWWVPARHVAIRTGLGVIAAGLVIWHPRAIFFAVGVFVARTDLTRHTVLRQALRAPGVMLAGFFACWYAVQFGFGAHGESTMLDWAHDGRIGLAALAISMAILAFAGIVAGAGMLCRVLQGAAMQWLGTVSYSFYLWHIIVIAIGKRVLSMSGVFGAAGPLSQLLLLAVCLPVSLLVARISLRLIEQRLAGWLRRQRANMRGMAVSIGPAKMRA